MRVLFLSQVVPYPPHGGVLQRGYNILRELHRHCEVHLLAFVHRDILGSAELVEESRVELSKFCGGVEYFDLWPKKSIFHKYLGFCSSIPHPMPFSVLAHRSSAFRKRVADIAGSGGADIVHFDTIALTQFDGGHIMAPRVLTHHNIESRLMERRAEVEKNPLKKSFLSVQAKRLYRHERAESPKFDVNILVSEVDEKVLRERAPDAATTVVPNGVDTQYFTPRRGEETPAVIYTGGMNMFANMDAVLYFLESIFPLIKARVPGVKFYAVGQDPPPELLRISREDPSVEVTGYVSDIRPLAAKASVYVVPLRVGGGTRLKVLDAMAMGKAIVSTSIGCEGIEVKHGRDLIIADNPALFAEKACALLSDREMRLKFGDAARKLAESKYSWEFIGKKLVDVYSDAVRNGGQRRRP